MGADQHANGSARHLCCLNAVAHRAADSCPPPPLQLLHSRGVDLVRVEVIPDDKRDIVETVLRLRERVGGDGFVFTSGGIGELAQMFFDRTHESLHWMLPKWHACEGLRPSLEAA